MPPSHLLKRGSSEQQTPKPSSSSTEPPEQNQSEVARPPLLVTARRGCLLVRGKLAEGEDQGLMIPWISTEQLATLSPSQRKDVEAFRQYLEDVIAYVTAKAKLD